MIKKVSIATHGEAEIFGNPAPLGLLGLAIACAALVPAGFGHGVGPEGIKPEVFGTAAVFALLFGGGCQLISGLMNFANRNTFGGTIFTAFAFNWIITAISFFGVAMGWNIDHATILSTEIILFVAFVFLTYGFGFFSSTLFLFLLDIDLLYVCKIIRGFTHTRILDTPIGVLTVLLGLIGLWLALAGLINPVSGSPILKIGGPMFRAARKKAFDFSIRRAVFEVLFSRWKEQGFTEMPVKDLVKAVSAKAVALTGGVSADESAGISLDPMPEVLYLWEYGCLKVTFDGGDDPGHGAMVKSARLTAGGIDLYEQLILRKYEF